jgi:hypothetical protein
MNCSGIVHNRVAHRLFQQVRPHQPDRARSTRSKGTDTMSNVPDQPETSNSWSRSRTRRNTAMGVTAGILGGGAIGLLMAVPSWTSAASDSSTTDSTVAAVVQDTSSDSSTATDDAGADPTAPQAEPGAGLRELLQPLVDDGTITAAQADTVADYLVANRPERGDGGRGGEHGPGGRRGGPGFDGEVVAGLLGIDVDALRTELRDGKTIAAIATEQGVDVQSVIDALVAEAKTHLDLSVTNGRLTQEEADAKLIEVTERITDGVNNGRPARGDAPADAPPPADAPADVTADVTSGS